MRHPYRKRPLHVAINSSHSVNATLMKSLPYDLTKDVLPITEATTQPYALVVHPSVQAKTVKDLIALAKAKPELNYGSSGTGGLSHLSGALFSSLTQIEIVHIPYKGGNPAMIEVIAKRGHLLQQELTCHSHSSSPTASTHCVTVIFRLKQHTGPKSASSTRSA